MKKIAWQRPVTLVHIAGLEPPKGLAESEKTLSFEQFLKLRLTDPRQFGADMSRVVIAVKLAALIDVKAREALRAADMTALFLELEDTDYELLKAATQSPVHGYEPGMAHCIVHFMQAVVNAETA